MELEQLLIEKAEISKKVDSAKNKLKLWFENKKREASELFSKAKTAATNSAFSKKAKEGKVGKNFNTEGLSISANESCASAKNKCLSFIKKLLNEIKDCCSAVIKSCQRAMQKIIGIDVQSSDVIVVVADEKKTVLEKMGNAAKNGAAVINIAKFIVSALLLAKATKDLKK